MKLEVYKITNKTNGKIYVGITSQGISTRWHKHCSDAVTDSPFPIHNAIRKYGKDNFQIELIEDLSDKDYDYLKEREVYWIKEFNSYDREKGYNLTLGGDGTFGRFRSEETKDKIRQKALGRIVSKEARAKMSESHKNRKYSNKELKIRSENGIRTRKKIVQFDLNNSFIREFNSISDAATATETDRRNIGNYLNDKTGKRFSCAGYIWKYKEEDLNK